MNKKYPYFFYSTDIFGVIFDIFLTDDIRSGTHIGMIRPIFLKIFFVSNSTPLAVWTSIIPFISEEKTGIKRITVIIANAYLYGILSFDTSTLVRSLICVTESIIVSGSVAAISLNTSRSEKYTPLSVTVIFNSDTVNSTLPSLINNS